MKKITYLMCLVTICQSMAQVLSEDFSSGTVGGTFPNGWTSTVEPGSSGSWVVFDTALGLTTTSPDCLAAGGSGTPCYGGAQSMINGGADGIYALLDSDGYGSGVVQNASLTSPVVDLSGYSELVLKFNHHFRVYNANADIAYVEASTNGGSTWQNVTTFTGAQDYTAEGLTSIDISAFAGNSAVQIRFRYVGAWGYYWGIDNIEISECTASAPVAVTSPTLPADGATGVEIDYGLAHSISFEWPVYNDSAGSPVEVDSYILKFSTTPNVDATDPGYVGELTTTANSIIINYGSPAAAGWASNTTYYWTVDSVNCNSTAEGTVFSFTTGACATFSVPAAVNTPTPENNSTIALDNSNSETPNAVTFSWVDTDSTTGENSYVLVLDTDPTLITAQTFDNFGNGTVLYGLSDNTTYYWRIDSYNCFGSVSSNTWSFTTSSTAGLNDLNQNSFSAYPNPVNDILNIKGNGVIDNLEVLNQLGQRVLAIDGSLLTNKQLNISSLESGLYFIRLTANNKTEILQVIKQ